MFAFLKENGYVWETGMSGHFTYGPQGKLLKNNLEYFFRRKFGREGDFIEIETPLIFKRSVWENSGHWNKFQDPVVRTVKGKNFRIDKLLEEYGLLKEDQLYEKLKEEEVVSKLLQLVDSGKLKLEEDDQLLIPNLEKGQTIEYQNLMMVTHSGRQESGLRPETATSTFHHVHDLSQFCGHLEAPIKVFQIGRSFRNEISPKHNLIRGREFTQAEFQVILLEKNKNDSSNLLNSGCFVNFWNPEKTTIETIKIEDLHLNGGVYYRDLICFTYQIFLELGLPAENIRLRQHQEDEKAFYALDAWDIEVNLQNPEKNPMGWTEVAGIHDRGGYDLRNDEHYQDRHILEVAIGVDRLLYSILDNLYEEKSIAEGKNMFKIPYRLAPIQVSVLPLMKNKSALTEKAQEIYRMLKSYFIVDYAEKKSIGKRYLKNAVRGIPYSLTVDFDTLEDNTVTVRDRDTESQNRMPIENLINFLSNKFR